MQAFFIAFTNKRPDDKIKVYYAKWDCAMEQIIRSIIEEKFVCSVSAIRHIGKGASGEVFKISFDKAPYDAVVKISRFADLIEKEYKSIEFISSRVACKLPKLYFMHRDKAFSLICMEYIAGVSGNSRVLHYKLNKKKLANSIVDNLLKIQTAHNDKFGPYENAVFDTWFDYYSAFAKDIYEFSLKANKENRLSDSVMHAVEASYERLDKILAGGSEAPTLIHGDYWLPNFIVNPKTMELAGVLDPFNVMWAEPEYELFCLTVGYGKNLHLYENYKSKVKTSSLCDVKLELYALYNELLWYKELGSISEGYLKMRSRRLLKEMKRHGIIQK